MRIQLGQPLTLARLRGTLSGRRRHRVEVAARVAAIAVEIFLKAGVFRIEGRDIVGDRGMRRQRGRRTARV